MMSGGREFISQGLSLSRHAPDDETVLPGDPEAARRRLHRQTARDRLSATSASLRNLVPFTKSFASRQN
jgi:hypothetical protein